MLMIKIKKQQGKLPMKKTNKKVKQWTILDKIMLLVCGVLCLCGALFMVNMHKYEILFEYYKDYVPQPLNLTEQEKLEDFAYYYDTMLSSFPMFEDYKEAFGYDFEEKRKHYEDLIKETESDYEFYCVMRAIVNELPSFHTDLVFPRFAQYQTLGCYNMTRTLCISEVYPASIYWDELLESEYDRQEMEGTVYTSYKYINGEYISQKSQGDVLAESKLLAVNGMNIDDYVYENIFTRANKKYDKQKKKLYLDTIYMNNRLGEPVTLTLEDVSGNVYYVEAYCETPQSAGYYLDWVYGDKEVIPSVRGLVYHYIDRENNLGYIELSTFNIMFAEDMEAALNEMKDCDAIILDLRENSGGLQTVAQESVYPYLFSEDVSLKNKWYMIDSPDNRRIILEDKICLLFNLKMKRADKEEIISEKDRSYFSSVRSYRYKGKAEKEREIYVLIGQDTGSAGDGFAAALKHTSATIMGDNTYGEGLAKSFTCDYLPNSGLVFCYMFGKGINEDGTDNSLYGTAPDIYSYISVEGYHKRDALLEEEIDPYTYENRLKWDDTLIEAVKEITVKLNK